MGSDNKSRTGYHHGNLKEALLAAAHELILEKGPYGFTLAEAARLAGVSPAAPYRHFKDRTEIIGALALGGFGRLTQAMEQAWENGRPDAVTAFLRVARAYLSFANKDPAIYKIMFEPGIVIDHVGGIRTARSRAFDVLRTCSAALLVIAPQSGTKPPIDLMCVHLWSQMHGTAALFADGQTARGRVPLNVEDVLESSILVYLRGLAIIPLDDI